VQDEKRESGAEPQRMSNEGFPASSFLPSLLRDNDKHGQRRELRHQKPKRRLGVGMGMVEG